MKHRVKLNYPQEESEVNKWKANIFYGFQQTQPLQTRDKGEAYQECGGQMSLHWNPQSLATPPKTKGWNLQKTLLEKQQHLPSTSIFGGFHISIVYFRSFVYLLRVGIQKHCQVKTDLANLLGDDSWLPSSFTKTRAVIVISIRSQTWSQIDAHVYSKLNFMVFFHITLPSFLSHGFAIRYTYIYICIYYRSVAVEHMFFNYDGFGCWDVSKPQKDRLLPSRSVLKIRSLEVVWCSKLQVLVWKLHHQMWNKSQPTTKKTSTKARGDRVLSRLPYLFLYRFRLFRWLNNMIFAVPSLDGR